MADDDFNETSDGGNETLGETLAAAIEQHEGKAAIDTATAHESRSSSERTEHSRQSRDTTDSSSRSEEDHSVSDSSVAHKRESATSRSQERQSETKVESSEIPTNWSAKDKAAFGKLAPEAREFVLRHHKETAEFRREYDPVNKLFEPYRERMKAGGWSPHKLIEAWSNVEKRLMEGDAVNVIAGLATAYKVNLGDVAKTLGLRPRQPQTNGQTEPNGQSPQPQPEGMLEHQLPPQVARQLQAIQDRFAAEDRARADAVRRQMTATEHRVMNEIDQFKSAREGKGNSLHPHFDEVEEAMVLLAQSANAAKKPMALKDLYETAVWANPKLREETLAARERDKAVRARRAGSSVTGGPGRANLGRSDRSLGDEIRAAMGER
jgi:hypothetical protein